MERKIRIFNKYFGILGILIPLILVGGLVSKAYAPSLGISVTKVCENAVASGEPIIFYGVVTNTGGLDLEVTVVDDHAGVVFGPQILTPGASANYSGSYIPTTSPSTNTVTATGVYGTTTVQATADATCVIEEQGDEGCTPGYWKNHLSSWGPTGYSPTDDFDTVFGVDLFNPDITLQQAINMGGGGVNKLARHGTAALLNATHPDLNYPLTEAEVIAYVQAGNSEILVEYNELGCPLDDENTTSINRMTTRGLRGRRN